VGGSVGSYRCGTDGGGICLRHSVSWNGSGEGGSPDAARL
jgi:hypothetical protein